MPSTLFPETNFENQTEQNQSISNDETTFLASEHINETVLIKKGNESATPPTVFSETEFNFQNETKTTFLVSDHINGTVLSKKVNESATPPTVFSETPFSKNDSMLMMRISSLISDGKNETTNPEKETFIRLEPSIAGLISAALSDKTDHLLNQLLKSNKKGKNIFN